VKDLSPIQRRILTALTRSLDEGPAPTVRELADQLKMKRSTVHYHLQALQRAGYVAGEGRHRDLVLTAAGRAASGKGAEPKRAEAVLVAAHMDGDFTIPIVGSVAAGQPILAAETHAGEVSLSSFFQRKGTLFALQVAGDSMIGDGICDGDFAIVRQQVTASPGDIVVAMIEDGEASEATVKRYREDGGAIVLEPSNPAYTPLRFDGQARERLQVLGKLVGVVRKL
jgi:repressor LexA